MSNISIQKDTVVIELPLTNSNVIPVLAGVTVGILVFVVLQEAIKKNDQ